MRLFLSVKFTTTHHGEMAESSNTIVHDLVYRRRPKRIEKFFKNLSNLQSDRTKEFGHLCFAVGDLSPGNLSRTLGETRAKRPILVNMCIITGSAKKRQKQCLNSFHSRELIS